MQAVKPNRTQRQIIADAGLDTYKWRVQKDKPKEMHIINIETKEVKVLPK